MFQQKFINRSDELAFLEKLYKERGAQFVIIYGRRRVGKTELVRQFIKDKRHIYFLADERSDIVNLTEFKKEMAGYLNDSLLEKAEIKEWSELFIEFTKKLKNKKTIIVIDEFPYLIKSNKAMPSIMQKVWDLNLKNENIILIMLGSSISVMETDVLDYKSPLYGRRTAQWKLEPLKFRHIHQFFRYDIKDLIVCYAALDGVPLYLLKFDPAISVSENLKNKIFTKGEFLYEEAEILLRQEVREPANYFNILKAISFRKHSFGEIVNFSKLDKSLVSKYLENLIKLRVVSKEYSITQKKETRNIHYIISDNYFNFWFRFVYPNKSLIEEGMQKILIENIQEDFNLYLSNIFEKICLEFLIARAGKLPFLYNKMGRWWHKDCEIDIVALNDKTKEILFCECKWKDNADGKAILNELKGKTNLVDWNKGRRKEYYVIFAKSFKEKFKEDNVLLFDLENLKQELFKA